MPTKVWTDTEGIEFTVDEDYGVFRTLFGTAKKYQSPTVNCTIDSNRAFIVTEKIVGFTPAEES